MYHVSIIFQAVNHRLDSSSISAKGLHGLLFHVLYSVDPQGAAWLHKHTHNYPKPFSLMPLYTDKSVLAGIRLGALTERTAGLFERAWDWYLKKGQVLQLGRQSLQVESVTLEQGPNWSELMQTVPVRRLGLHFLSPTSFRQGPGHLPLPVPYNVFTRPWRVYLSYAPFTNLSGNWLDWCRDNVFVVEHNIETATVVINQNERINGFVGHVVFNANKGVVSHFQLLHMLSRVANYSGIGQKTSMGMGAIELFEDATNS